MAYDYNMGGAGSSIGGLLGGFLGGSPSDAINKKLKEIPGAISPYYQPYIGAGKKALPVLEEQYGRLVNNPSELMQMIGKNFQSSPGYDFAKDEGLRAINQAAAAGGMAGSRENQQESARVAEGFANQDFYNFLSRAMGLYDKGLQGFGGLYDTGFNASKSYADELASVMAQEAAQEGASGNWWNKMTSAGGSLLGAGLGFL